MKALVYRGQHMMVEDVPDPEPEPGEVLLKVRYCGICGSDVHLLSRGIFFSGAIPGHEVSAEVVAPGPGVSGWQPGDIVATAGGGKCGQCEYCLAGKPHLCQQPKEGFGLGRRPGGYSQWLVADQETLLRVPPHLDPAHAALTEPLAVALHAVELSEVEAGQGVLVTGAGPIGLLVVEVLKSRGARPIIVSEPAAGRRALAARLDVDQVVDPTTEDLAEVVRASMGRGPHVVMESSGAAAAAQAGFGLLRPAGVLVAVGSSEASYSFSSLLLMARELRVQGSYGSGGRMPAALDMLAAGKVQAADIITRVISLAEGDACMRELGDSPADGKVLIDPWLGL
jgi:2-desacetyl-2-hydroxyethyl bacteriochlorophyllide A dehydrogenase